MENLPIELQWHIMKFMRHPVADLIVEALDKSYRSATDRGLCDAYYSRQKNPNIQFYRIKNTKRKYWSVQVSEENMMPEDILAYNSMYDSEENRKDMHG